MSDPVADLKQELLAAAERRLEHAAPAPNSRRRWLGHDNRRRRAIVFALAALALAVGSASAIGSVRDLILDRGFVGLPPEGATPSAPDGGELVLQWEGFTGTHAAETHAIFRAWVYADGRFIWDRREHDPHPRGGIPEGANELISGYLEQRLTPDGVELVRSAVAGLFERSRTLLETVPAEVWPLMNGARFALFVPEDADFSGWGAVGVRDGDRLVRLHWVPGWGRDGDWNREHYQGTLATPEQLSALRRVEALLTDSASALPSSAWAEPKVRAYVPSHYAVCMDHTPPVDVSEVLSLLPAPAAALLRDEDLTRREGDLIEAREGGQTVVVGREVTYCAKLPTEQAREVADALSGLEPEPGWNCCVLGYRLAEGPTPVDPSRIWFEPYFPHGQSIFSRPFG